MRPSTPFFLVMALGTLTFLTVMEFTRPVAKEVKVSREFVCYDDGVLVERHVGVKAATRAYRSGDWYIEYTDPQTGWYRPDAGETCQVEDNRVPSILDEDS